jgi:hypothetical protein
LERHPAKLPDTPDQERLCSGSTRDKSRNEDYMNPSSRPFHGMPRGKSAYRSFETFRLDGMARNATAGFVGPPLPGAQLLFQLQIPFITQNSWSCSISPKAHSPRIEKQSDKKRDITMPNKSTKSTARKLNLKKMTAKDLSLRDENAGKVKGGTIGAGLGGRVNIGTAGELKGGVVLNVDGALVRGNIAGG